MGNKPKRERFEPGEKGDAKWVEAVDKWRREKSVMGKARYKNGKLEQKVNMAQILDGRRSIISSPVVIKKYRKRKKKRKRRKLLTQGDTEDDDESGAAPVAMASSPAALVAPASSLAAPEAPASSLAVLVAPASSPATRDDPRSHHSSPELVGSIGFIG